MFTTALNVTLDDEEFEQLCDRFCDARDSKGNDFSQDLLNTVGRDLQRAKSAFGDSKKRNQREVKRLKERCL